MLPANEHRCVGHGAGPSGHQIRLDCVNCQRRTEPRAEALVFTEPPKAFPCPYRIAAVTE